MMSGLPEINGVKLTPEKAAIIDKTAIIADLHLGFENVMQMKGVAIPRMQIRSILNSIKKIIKKYNVNKLIIAGDLKHEFSKNLPYEWEDVKTFIESLDVDISIIRGNHDNFLATILAKYGIDLKEYEKVGEYYIVHGHREVSFDRFIMGHEHPAIKVRVRGATYVYPCYLVVDDKNIVLPAFSPLMQGSDVLQGEFLSPNLSYRRKIEVYAIEKDVFYLGSLNDIRRAVSNF